MLGTTTGLVPVASIQPEGRENLGTATGDILIPDILPDGLGNLPENLVPRGMAVSIVDPFEVVDIGQDDAESAVLFLGPFNFLIQCLVEITAIVEPCHGIG
jgi:hypothetical protein